MRGESKRGVRWDISSLGPSPGALHNLHGVSPVSPEKASGKVRAAATTTEKRQPSRTTATEEESLAPTVSSPSSCSSTRRKKLLERQRKKALVFHL